MTKVDYVLVLDLTDNGKLYYYEGYYDSSLPKNTQEFTMAVKIPYKEEAEALCKKINDTKSTFKYHVEEHAYFPTEDTFKEDSIPHAPVPKRLDRPPLRTGQHIFDLLSDWENGVVTKEEAMWMIFCNLSLTHGEGHTSGWNSAEKRYNKDKK